MNRFTHYFETSCTSLLFLILIGCTTNQQPTPPPNLEMTATVLNVIEITLTPTLPNETATPIATTTELLTASPIPTQTSTPQPLPTEVPTEVMPTVDLPQLGTPIVTDQPTSVGDESIGYKFKAPGRYIVRENGLMLPSTGPHDGPFLDFGWRNDLLPEDIPAEVDAQTKNFPDLEITTYPITVGGVNGTAIQGLPGVEVNTLILLPVGDRVFELRYYGEEGLDFRAWEILDTFHFTENLASAEKNAVLPIAEVQEILEYDQQRSNLEKRLVTEFAIEPYQLSINPSLTTALITNIYDQTITLFQIESGEQSPIELEGDIRLIGDAVWLNNTSALVNYESPNYIGGGWGPVARFDTVSGEITQLEPAVALNQPPILIPGAPGSFAFATQDGVYRLDDGQKEANRLDFDLSGSAKPFMSAPALSSDGRSMIRLDAQTTDSGDLIWAYLFESAQGGPAQELLAFNPPAMGGGLPPALWHPDGRFAVIEPLTRLEEEMGLTLIDANNPAEPIFLGVGTTRPRWVPSTSFLYFEELIDGVVQGQLYNVETSERATLNSTQ